MENTKIEEHSSIEELLLKIISKAEINGFQFRTGFKIENIEFLGFGRFYVKFENNEQENKEKGYMLIFHINEIFFNHNFAKAFFGDQEYCANCGKTLKKVDWDIDMCHSCGHDINEVESGHIESWQYHLKKMVLCPNVLDYLQNFLKQ